MKNLYEFSTWIAIGILLILSLALYNIQNLPTQSIIKVFDQLVLPVRTIFKPELSNKDTPSQAKISGRIQELIKSDSKSLFRVTRVIDGDTIVVEELGTIRLLGIDTPETKDSRRSVQCFGQEAANKAQELLVKQKVYLEFDPNNTIDKYDRILAYVYREDGYDYNLAMLQDGYAFSYKQFPHPRLEEFNQVEKQARQDNRGLWSPQACPE